MKIGRHDTDDQVVIVAEIGNNHEGDVEVATRMVHEAAAAGADVVKFQTFQTDHYVGPQNPDRIARLRSFELTRDEFRRLAGVARDTGVTFLSTPLDIGSATFLAELAPALKIASGDNTFYPLLDAAASTGLPLILSCGLADLPTLRYVQAYIHEAWRRYGVESELALLHCVSAYPVPPEDANVAAVRTLAEEFGGCVGYSDHTEGIEASVLAVASGARILEKHFTLDKAYSDFRDHQLSADPAEMAELVQRVRSAERLLGNGTKAARPAERPLLEVVRRSVAVARDLPAGSILSPADLTWLRPAGGIPPGRESEVLGRRLIRDLTRGTPLDPADLEAP